MAKREQQRRIDALRQIEAFSACSDEELTQGLADGIDSISADGPVGELVLEAFKANPDLTLGD